MERDEDPSISPPLTEHNIPPPADQQHSVHTGSDYNKQLLYGDPISVKTDDILRLGFQNFNGLTGRDNDPVDVSLRQWITKWDFDVFGLSEVNMYWPQVRKELQFLERVNSWFNPLQTRALCSYNKNEIRKHRSIRQYGGTAQISRGNAALRQVDRDEDPSGLGRWVWQKYMGKDQRVLRVITAYRPIKTAAASLYTVYRQHWAHYKSLGTERDPRAAILDDLTTAIQEWRKDGEHIVLMMDANEDVRGTTMTQFLATLQMREVILERNGEDVAPRTHIRGQKPIDGIFVTDSIDIINGGYASFDQGVQARRADHRCLWIDIHVVDVFGHRMPGPVKFQARRVNGQDPRTINAFNAHYKAFALRTGLARRIFWLEDHAVYPLPIELHAEAEAIAQLRYEGIQYADKRCRKLHLGGAAYTPEFKSLEATLKTFNLLIAKREHLPKAALSPPRKCPINSSLIQRQHRASKMALTLSELYQLDLPTLRDKAKRAYKAYRRYWDHSAATRDTWLEDLAKARAAQELRKQAACKGKPPGKRKKAKPFSHRTAAQLRTLRATEQSRKFYARIKRAIGKDQLAGISMVIAPDHNGQLVQKTKHSDITAALIQEHHAKYHQTEGTPPMRGPLLHQLGYLGIGKEADDILQGRYTRRPGTDDASAALLAQLQTVDPLQRTLPVGISAAEYQSGWSKVKEKTSAGGNTLHFGHCKAIARDAELSEMESAFISIPLRSGYVFRAWKYGVDCVLPKKKNELLVHALRTIVLLEADFNFLNKHVARKAMANAELLKQGIAPEQYGSRKFFRAIDHVLNKIFSFDLLRQFKRAGIVIPTDLKSCYDRICHAIAALSLRRQGVAESEVVCMFSTLQNLKHTIRCAYGTSTESYGDERWAVPMQGVYQGNGAGPVIWAVVSSPVLQLLRKEGYGAFFKAAISGNEIRLVGYAFVDDTDLIQTGISSMDSFASVFTQAQKALDRWEALIKATGGALAVSKCRWWAVDFAWNADGSWQYRRTVELPGVLRALDHDNIRKVVPRLDHTEAYETLGVFVAPDGNHQVEYEYLMTKAKRWADKLRTATLREHETAVALKATILKTLEYPLPALFLTDDECRRIMSVVLNAALPKAKFNRTFCRKTLYAPGSHGGQEISNLKHAQTVAHVDAIIRHGLSDTIASDQLKGSLEVAKLELGLPGPLFQHPFPEFGELITDSWVRKAWKEFTAEKISVTECTQQLAPSRHGDSFLIAAFHRTGFRKTKLVRLNRCRIRLQVVTLSDLCTGDGRYVLPQAFSDGFPGANRGYDWPAQGPLPKSDWSLWKRALRKAFRLQDKNKLAIPLGRWIPTVLPTSAWHDLFHQNTYVRRADGWHHYHHNPAGLHQPRTYTYQGTVAHPPPDLRKAVAWVDDEGLQYHGSSPLIVLPPTVCNTLHQAIHQLAPEWKWALEKMEWTIDPATLAQHIRNGTAKAIADGSYKEQKGTAAFAIVTADGSTGIYGMNRTPGPTATQCSYRSENGGLVGILLLCHVLHRAYGLQHGQLVLGCDNIESGKKCIQYHGTARPTDNHYDILHAARTLRSWLPFQPSYLHVEGHQRTKYPGRPLDLWATLNENMDALAKAYWRHTSTWDRPEHCMPNEWVATFNGHRIVTNFTSNLKLQLARRDIEHKWLTPRGTRKKPRPALLTQAQLTALDHCVAQRAWKQVPGNRQRFTTKLRCGLLPTGARMQQFGFWNSSQCPLCLKDNETTDHVFWCQDTRASECRVTALAQFAIDLKELYTAANIQEALMLSLRSALLGNPLDLSLVDRPDLQLAIRRQWTLGSLALTKGQLCDDWRLAQHRAFCNYAPWRNGEQWAAAVTMKLWALSFSLWEHRNAILHERQENHPDIDPDAIDLAILEEWTIGPQPEWSHGSKSLFRGTTCEALLSKTLPHRRQWLHYVRLARSVPLLPDESPAENIYENPV
jgi:hypothetical protein